MDAIKKWFYYKTDDPFIKVFSLNHFFGLLIVASMVFLVIKYKEKLLNNVALERKVSMFIGILSIISMTFLKIYESNIAPWQYNMPLHYCSIALIFGLLSMFTYNKYLSTNMIFLGLTGGVLGILTPGISQGFPYYRFIEYFISHGLLILMSIYIIIIRGICVTKKDILNYMVLAVGSSLIILLYNNHFGTIFMFLNDGLPEALSNVLPIWPFYYPILILILYLVSLIIYYSSNIYFKNNITEV